MLQLKAMLNGNIRNIIFGGYKIAGWSVAKNGWPKRLYGFQRGNSPFLMLSAQKNLGGMKKTARSLSIKR